MKVWIGFGLVALTIMGLFGYVLYALKQEVNRIYIQCEFLGITRESCGVTMNVQCLSDCRILGYKEFRWNNQGFGGDTCWCLDNENKPIQIW
mgnify:FL=1